VIRDGSLLARAFGAKQPEYYRGGEGPAGTTAGPTDDHDGHDVPGQLNFYKLGFEGTRRWRALKLWMSWKHVGTRGFGRLVADTIDLAALLARRCSESADFEALPPQPELSVVCFRHIPPGANGGPALDDHQDRLQAALEADGDGWLSTTRLRGSTWLRAGIVNPHTTPADIDRLLATLRRLAADMR
jgi:glutamate/tyrosine decarboxylase-like PLP-dependent enzyme